MTSKSKFLMKSYDQDTNFHYVYIYCDLDRDNITLGQGHDTPLGHGQQLCEISPRSNMTLHCLRSYSPCKDYGIVCTVTLTLEISLGQNHDRPLGHGGTIMKYYPNQASK